MREANKPRMDFGGDTDVAADLRKKVGGQIDALVRDADDLYTKINDDINDDINESREHYQVTLWIVLPASGVGLLIMAGLMWSFYGWVFNPIRDLETGVQPGGPRRFRPPHRGQQRRRDARTWPPPSTT